MYILLKICKKNGTAEFLVNDSQFNSNILCFKQKYFIFTLYFYYLLIEFIILLLITKFRI